MIFTDNNMWYCTIGYCTNMEDSYHISANQEHTHINYVLIVMFNESNRLQGCASVCLSDVI